MPSPQMVTGTATCVDELGNPEPGIVLTFWLTKEPAGTGFAFSGGTRTATSNEAGTVTLPHLIVGATYKVRRGSEVGAKEFIVPANNFDLPNLK